MPDREKVFDALRCCITEGKCRNCPWEDCKKVGGKRVTVPVTLMLDVLKLLKEQPEIVRCKDCKHYMTIHCTCDGCCISDDWFCAAGEAKKEVTECQE